MTSVKFENRTQQTASEISATSAMPKTESDEFTNISLNSAPIDPRLASLVQHLQRFDFEQTRTSIKSLLDEGMTRKDLVKLLKTHPTPIAQDLADKIEKDRSAGITGGRFTFVTGLFSTKTGLADRNIAAIEPILKQVIDSDRKSVDSKTLELVDRFNALRQDPETSDESYMALRKDIQSELLEANRKLLSTIVVPDKDLITARIRTLSNLIPEEISHEIAYQANDERELDSSTQKLIHRFNELKQQSRTDAIDNELEALIMQVRSELLNANKKLLKQLGNDVHETSALLRKIRHLSKLISEDEVNQIAAQAYKERHDR